MDKVVSAKDLLKNSNEYYEELSRKRKKVFNLLSKESMMSLIIKDINSKLEKCLKKHETELKYGREYSHPSNNYLSAKENNYEYLWYVDRSFDIYISYKDPLFKDLKNNWWLDDGENLDFDIVPYQSSHHSLDDEKGRWRPEKSRFSISFHADPDIDAYDEAEANEEFHIEFALPVVWDIEQVSGFHGEPFNILYEIFEDLDLISYFKDLGYSITWHDSEVGIVFISAE